jgi:cob(I)alamin adenosyltransferase
MYSYPNTNIIQAMKRVFTGSGDKGFTGLLGDERVPKHHPQPETFGSLDEASASLGMARAFCDSKEISSDIEAIQQDLYHAMAELAATPENREKFQKLNVDRVQWLESKIQTYSQSIQIPDEFVTSGSTKSGATFDLARTTVRKAERAVAKLHHEGENKYDVILQYLNRLSSLCFVLLLWADQEHN